MSETDSTQAPSHASTAGPAEENPHVGLRDAWRHPRRWSASLSTSRSGLWMIGVASFLETIIVPIPIEIVMIPYMLARRDLLWRIAAVTTLGCLLAATFGYGLGYFFYDSVGRGLIELMNWQDDYATFQNWFDAQGFWAILAIGIAPIPFQVAMLVAGVAGYPLLLFILAATIARGIRYFGLAYLVHRYGERAMTIWEENRLKAGIGVLVLIGAIVALNMYAFR
jgi:membrane protein YqaA with SNARE-associated domain